MVVMNGINHDDLLSMAELAKDLPIQMRFIEEMPFNGADHVHKMTWNHIRILERIREKYPEIQPISFKSGETAQRYQVPGWKGSLGIIAAFSRTFCGTCNRLRITPNGTLKTCLYDDGVLDLRALLRSDSSDREILQAVIDAVANKPKNGWEAEQMRKVGNIAESMATIGG
jgi:cyclic pyranopterin phosphate synthase